MSSPLMRENRQSDVTNGSWNCTGRQGKERSDGTYVQVSEVRGLMDVNM